MPESLAEQLPQLLQQLKNHGIPQIKIDGWEADDVIATMAVKGRHYGLQVTILSTDKGFCQLVDDSIRVRNHFDQITFDLETVRGRWGFEPHQLPDFWALTGDTTNHLPGVSGIGRKGAADIMSAAGNLNRAFAFPQLITDKQSQLLQQHWHSAILTRELATLSTNVPLTQKLSEFRYRPNL